MLAAMGTASDQVHRHPRFGDRVGVEHVGIEHATALVVAVLYVALALVDGGYPPEFRAGAAIVLWWTVVIGIVLGLWPRAPIPRSALLGGMCLVGLAALAALSMAWASDDGRAFTEVIRILSYLGVFVAVVLGSSPRSVRGWLAGLTLGLVALGVLALGSRIEPGLFPNNDIAATIPGAAARVSYPLGYWNAVGACMTLAIVLLAWLAGSGRERWIRALATAVIPLVGLTLFLTASRGSMLALGAGLAALVLAGPRRIVLLASLALGGLGSGALVALAAARPDLLDGLATATAVRQGHEMVAVTALVGLIVAALRFGFDRRLRSITVSLTTSPTARRIAVGAAVLAVVVAVFAASPLERVSSFAEPPATPASSGLVGSHLTSSAGNGRYQYWDAALGAFASAPLTGVGAGGFESWWGENGTLGLPVRDAHSLFLEALGELGIAGLLLIVGFIAVAAVTAVRTRGREREGAARGAAMAILAAGVVTASIDWTWEMPAAFVPVIVAAALLTGPALAPPPRGDQGRFGYGVVTLLVAWLAILAGASSLAMEVKLAGSRDAVDRGDYPAAFGEASAASSLQPWSAAPYLQMAQVAELQNRLPEAESAISEAIERAPGDWRVWFVAARLDAARGDVPAYFADLTRVLELRVDIRLSEPVLDWLAETP